MCRSLIALLCTLLGVVSSSSADSEKLGELTSLSIEELMGLEVTGPSKLGLSSHDSPASVVVITEEQIRRFGFRTLAEALQQVSGMYVSNDRNYSYLGVRGFGRPGDYNTRVLLLVNGHKINDPVYDYAPIAEDLGIDIYSLQRIEITKGPASAAWGTNGILAVVNLVTKTGGSVGNRSAITEFGTHNRSKVFTEFGAIQGEVEYYGSLSGMASNGEKNIYFPELDTPSLNSGIAQELDEESAYRGFLQLRYQDWELMLNHGWRRKEIPTGAFGTLFATPGNRTWDYSTRIDLSKKMPLGDEAGSSLFTRIYYDDTRYYAHYLYADDQGTTRANQDNGSSKLLGAEIRYAQKVTDGLSLLVGAETQHAYDLRLKYFQYSPEYLPSLRLDDSFNLTSLFTELDVSPLRSLHFLTGVRLDHYSTSGSQWSPRAGVVVDAWQGGTLKLSYGRAFRAPNNYERNYTDGVLYLGNAHLDPEILDSLEFIVEQKAGSGIVGLSLYRYRLDDIISPETLDNELIQFRNMEKIESLGAELQYNARFEDGMLAYATMSIQRAEDSDTHLRTSNSPRILSTAGISVPVAGQRWYFSPQYRAIGPRTGSSKDSVPGGIVADLVLRGEKVISDVSVAAGIYNLLDKRLYSPSSEEHLQERIPQDGRTFQIQFRYEF